MKKWPRRRGVANSGPAIARRSAQSGLAGHHRAQDLHDAGEPGALVTVIEPAERQQRRQPVRIGGHRAGAVDGDAGRHRQALQPVILHAVPGHHAGRHVEQIGPLPCLTGAAKASGLVPWNGATPSCGSTAGIGVGEGERDHAGCRGTQRIAAGGAEMRGIHHRRRGDAGALRQRHRLVDGAESSHGGRSRCRSATITVAGPVGLAEEASAPG